MRKRVPKVKKWNVPPPKRKRSPKKRNETPEVRKEEMPAPIVLPKPELAVVKAAPTPLVSVTPLVASQDIQTGVTWADGQEVTAAQLNNTINDATILPTFYSGKPSGSPALNDSILYFDVSANALVLSSVDDTNVKVPVGGNLFLAGPTTGGSAIPAFRLITLNDLVFPTIILGSATNLDWSLASVFSKLVTANVTLTFSNMHDGQTIRLLLKQTAPGGHTVTWPAITWRGGAAPTPSAPGVSDLITITRFTTTNFGDYALGFV